MKNPGVNGALLLQQNNTVQSLANTLTVTSMNNSHACAPTLKIAHTPRALHASQVKMPYPLQSVRVS